MGLHEDVDDVAVLINGPPPVLPLTVDLHEDFVQMPCIAEPALSSSQLPRVVRTELPAPLANRFVRDNNSPFNKQILDLPGSSE